MRIDLTRQEFSRLLADAWQSADGLVDAYAHMKDDPWYAKHAAWRDRIDQIALKYLGRKAQ